jgi:Fic family protein
MKMPRTPPSFAKLLQDAQDDGRLTDILLAASNPATDSKYLHWDKLRHLAAPEGLTHEEWWLAIKMKRSTQLREIPLVDKSGAHFRFSFPAPIPERLHDVDLQAGGTLKDTDPLTNPAMKDQYLLRSLREEAITSSLIEGAATTREKARELLSSGRKPRDLADVMIVNNFRTMQHLATLRDCDLTSSLVSDIHKLITKGTLENPDDEGRLRASGRSIDVVDSENTILHIPPDGSELSGRMEAMCAFANAGGGKPFLHPVLRAVVLHFWLAYDHPFVDGNGRTARALFYWSMLRSGYWLAEFISISDIILNAPSQYGTAFLHTETDDNDLTYFILYHLEVLRRAIDALYEYIDRKSQELRHLQRDMRMAGMFNDRQRNLLVHALKHPNHEYTIEWHRGRQGVVYQTARTDLLELAEKGLMDKRKVGREWRFTPVADLDARLRE